MIRGDQREAGQRGGSQGGGSERIVAFNLLPHARLLDLCAALKLQSEHCNVVKGPNFNFQFVVPCLVLISSELRALSLSPNNLNLQFEKACITLRSSSILCEVWRMPHPR